MTAEQSVQARIRIQRIRDCRAKGIPLDTPDIEWLVQIATQLLQDHPTLHTTTP